jgi:hypothetical protein
VKTNFWGLMRKNSDWKRGNKKGMIQFVCFFKLSGFTESDAIIVGDRVGLRNRLSEFYFYEMGESRGFGLFPGIFAGKD